MIQWAEFALSYAYTIVIFFVSKIMAHEKFSSGIWIVSITMIFIENVPGELNLT